MFNNFICMHKANLSFLANTPIPDQIEHQLQ